MVTRSSSTAGQGGGIFYDGPVYSNKENQKLSQDVGIPSPPADMAFSMNHSKRVQHKDVVIIGGGLAGLSAALYLSQIDPERHITVLDRDFHNIKKTTVASFAAAGMLAPQSERLPMGPLLDLCLASRSVYRDFVDLVESLAQDPEGKEYLWPSDTNDNDIDDHPWSVGYVASGGFLAPAFAGDSVATWAPPSSNEGSPAPAAIWLDAVQVRELEPYLHPNVVGGWWFAEDASVDARRLTCSLRAACVAAGIHLTEGEVTSLDLVDGHCRGVWLKGSGKYLTTKSVLVANGAWMRQLLPVPMEPHKGQSISLRMPADRPPLLRRVLFAQDSYIVPKADGRIVVGATVEAGSYDANVTPAGLMHILSHALQLVPGLADLPLEETWVGLRPTTPDKGPILGKTPWDNLFLAGGYWRNGVLLAPKTGQLVATLLSGKALSPPDQALLDAFGWNRFTSPEGGAKLAANTRYAASMHPIHRRTSGSGVAAAVGTELGSYSTARSAGEERRKDRKALWNDDGDDSSLERAAELGRQDAAAFDFGNSPFAKKQESKKDEESASVTLEMSSSLQAGSQNAPPQVASPTSQYVASLQPSVTTPFDGTPDAFTVESFDDNDDYGHKLESPSVTNGFDSNNSQLQRSSSNINPLEKYPDLNDIYNRIRSNKATTTSVEMGESKPEERPDPGFRIYHVDKETGETRMVPPYTTPEEMTRMIQDEKAQRRPKEEIPSTLETTLKSESKTTPPQEYNEETYDGYQTIQKANSRASREEELEAMRAARRMNRMGTDSIDPSKIGAQRKPE